MKLDNKGVTLIEIIISVALISIVIIFLFRLLIQVNNENSDNEVKSSYLVNQATFIKQIEEDFLDYKFQSGDECDYTKIKKESNETTNEYLYLPRLKETANRNSNIKCLKFNFDPTKEYTYAYLFLYKREDLNNEKGYVTILSYYRGDFKQSVELEEYDWDMNNFNIDIKPVSIDLSELYAFSLPIVGPDYKDYSINLSYAK